MPLALARRNAATALAPTHISVTFKIVTPDQTRRITFTLSRMLDIGHDSWSVMFQLDERAGTTEDFQLVILLQVDVDHDDDSKAEATAAQGLNFDQHAQALVAADTANDVRTGDAPVIAAKQDAAAIISVRAD